MLFKLLYLPSSLNMTYYSSTCDSVVREPTDGSAMTKSNTLRFFLSLKNKLAENCRRAKKIQVDSIIP